MPIDLYSVNIDPVRPIQKETQKPDDASSKTVGVVISGAFIIFLLHNHSVIYKIIIFFSGEAKRQRNFFPFFICFIRELNPDPSLVRRRRRPH